MVGNALEQHHFIDLKCEVEQFDLWKVLRLSTSALSLQLGEDKSLFVCIYARVGVFVSGVVVGWDWECDNFVTTVRRG